MRPLPGSRSTALKRKINGMVVPRADSTRESCAAPPGTAILDPAPAESETDSTQHRPAQLSMQQRARANCDGIRDRPEAITSRAQGPTLERSCAQPPSPFGDAIALPHDLAAIFGCRPPLPDEAPEAYNSLQRVILSELKPADFIETLWATEIVDLTWEALHLRQARTQILGQARLAAVQHLIKPVVEIHRQRGMESSGGSSTSCLALGWICGAEREHAQVNQLLQERGLTSVAISAKALQLSRALSRRKFAVRALDSALSQPAETSAAEFGSAAVRNRS